ASCNPALQAQGDNAVPGRGKLPAIAQALRRRAENQRLRAERDLLKKAAAFFARAATGPPASSRTTANAGPCACAARPRRSRPPAPTPGASGRPAPGSNGAAPGSSRSGRSAFAPDYTSARTTGPVRNAPTEMAGRGRLLPVQAERRQLAVDGTQVPDVDAPDGAVRQRDQPRTVRREQGLRDVEIGIRQLED